MPLYTFQSGVRSQNNLAIVRMRREGKERNTTLEQRNTCLKDPQRANFVTY